MSIRDYKITDEQFNEKGMTSLPDTLNGTPYENKKSLGIKTKITEPYIL